MRSDLVYCGERVDDLQNGLFVIQDPKKFCFGMDAVLLSGFARVKRGEVALEILDGGNVEMHQMLCLPGCLSVVLLQPVYCGGQLSAVGTTLVCSADKYGVAD